MHLRCCLALLLLSPLACTPDFAKTDAKPADQAEAKPDEKPPAADVEEAEPEKDDWQPRHKEMVAALDLTESEAATLKAAFEAREAEVAKWQAEHGAELVALERQMREAARARDLGGVQQATSQARPLRDAIEAILEKHEAAIEQALPESKRMQWRGHALAKKLLELAEPLNLQQAQIDEIHAEATAAAQKSAGEKNPEAAGYLALEKAVEGKVFTPEQRAEFTKIKKKNPLRSLK